MMNELKANLIKLTRFEEITNHAEADYESDSENVEYEETFDRAYQNEFNMFVKVVNQLSTLLGISENTAKKMLTTKRAEIISILNM